MSTETLEISLNKETTFDFELSITGISANDAKVRFGLELPGFTLQIPCSRGDDKMWGVTIPALDKFVEEGQYTFTIELIANGYHFAPVKGTAALSPTAEVVGSVPRKSVEVAVTSITPKKSIVKDTEETEDKPEKKKKKDKPKKSEEKDKVEETEESIAEPVEEKKESVIDKMINKLQPFETGRSILSQMQEKKYHDDNRPESDKKVRNILKDI